MLNIKSMVNRIIAILVLTLLFSCEKESDLHKAQEALSGKYSIITATSNSEVDINLDGIPQNNLLLEIPDLESSYLELIGSNETEAIFAQYWQNQYFIGVEGKPINYDPSITVNFMNQATVASFRLKADLKSFQLSRSVYDPEFPLPEVVLVRPDRTIKVIMIKDVFTTSGWKTVTVEVIYSKFSS